MPIAFAVLEEQQPVGRDEVRHPAAFPEMPVQPQTAVHGVRSSRLGVSRIHGTAVAREHHAAQRDLLLAGYHSGGGRRRNGRRRSDEQRAEVRIRLGIRGRGGPTAWAWPPMTASGSPCDPWNCNGVELVV